MGMPGQEVTIRQQGAISLLDSQVVWGNTRPKIHIDD